jgi:hypothetical protein
MSRPPRSLGTAVFVCCLAALPAAAQDIPSPAAAPPPANLAFVDGSVDLVHEGAAERATAGIMLVDGDLVRTANGRGEIVFADGTLLHLDHDTELEILSPVRMRLSGGRLMLRVSAAATTPYVIDTRAAAVRFEPRGEYGLSADGRFERLELTVTRGVAELDDGSARTVVRGGEMATILGAGGRPLLQAFNSARWDAFELWSNDRRNGFSAATSSPLLPSELRPYGNVLDSYGRWDYVAPYGNVWFPAVGMEWRPYYTGSWRLTRYGWTWIGYDPWAWPTHHFGRWGFTGASWFWIPNRVWGPAWVSWSFVPGFVSWCPLGFDGRPVLPFGGRPGDHPAYWPRYDPWRAWTVVPRDTFGSRRAVRTHAIDPGRLPEETRRAMTTFAVPRAAAATSGVSGNVRLRPIGGGGAAIPPGAVAPQLPGTTRRNNNPYPPEYRPRGNVRNPHAPPAGGANGGTTPVQDIPTPAEIYQPPPAYRAPRGYEVPPEYRPPPAHQPPPNSAMPRRYYGGEARQAPATRDGDRNLAPPAYPPRPEASRPQRQDSSNDGGRQPSGNVAVPRGSSDSAQSASATRDASRPATAAGASGGARRRPQ